LSEPNAQIAVSAVRCGSVVMPRSSFFFDFPAYNEPDSGIEMDYLFFVVQSGSETTLVDCGFDPVVALRRGRSVLVSAETGLSELGITPEAVDRVIITHFHYDHVGNVNLFPNATLIAQAREIEFWSGPIAKRRRFAAVAEAPELELLASAYAQGRLQAIDGSGEVAPGISVELVGGHTPGQQVVHIDSGESQIVLASDALHCYEELEKDRPFALFSDLAGMYATFDRLRELQADGARIVAGHDPSLAARFGRDEPEDSPAVIRIA
jgi:glyoxylase-like metal-dependent hydrolase (beta-lactamase superfamily II)